MVLSRDAFPGTSCEAAIGVVPTGRAGSISQTASSQSLLRNVPEGRCDRGLARSAWKSAPQKSRPVGYGVIRAGVRTDSMNPQEEHLAFLEKHDAHFDAKYLRIS